jgi:hypothetical protein
MVRSSAQSFGVDSSSLAVIVEQVRQKKELCGLSGAFIEFHAFHFLRTHPAYSISKKAQLDAVVSYVRKQARTIYGVFQIPSLIQFRNQQLPCVSLDDSATISMITSSHISTQERVSFYPEFIQTILAKIYGGKKNLSSISYVDLGCGLHPVAFFSQIRSCSSYLAVEQSEVDAEYLQQFFEKNTLPAKAIGCDLVLELERLPSLLPSSVDVCFMFKLLDTLESQQRFITYTLFEKIPATYFVVSFSIKTISAQTTARGEKVGWFCKAMDRLGYSFESIVFASEVVYICQKM